MKKGTAVCWMASSALMVLVLAGCERTNPVESVRSVDWYASHDVERAEQLVKCTTNPLLLDATPDCVNASRAENRVSAATIGATENEDVRTTPPVTR